MSLAIIREWFYYISVHRYDSTLFFLQTHSSIRCRSNTNSGISSSNTAVVAAATVVSAATAAAYSLAQKSFSWLKLWVCHKTVGILIVCVIVI